MANSSRHNEQCQRQSDSKENHVHSQQGLLYRIFSAIVRTAQRNQENAEKMSDLSNSLQYEILKNRFKEKLEEERKLNQARGDHF